MTQPKALAFDLDGTLAESKQRPSSVMGDLISSLLSRMPVAVLSGASLPQFQTQLLPIFSIDTALVNLYLFPENAGQCFVFRDATWKPQYDTSFSPEESRAVQEALITALQATGLDTPPEQLWGERIEHRGAQISFSPLGQQAPVEAKEAWHQEHEPLRQELRKHLQALLPQFFIATGGMTTIDITHKGITKAYGIERFSELTGIHIQEMLYVGDALEEGGNDSVVIQTGIPTQAVFGPKETATLIEQILSQK
jgi:HAD superfamily hydrolase (TIGR01484 family)